MIAEFISVRTGQLPHSNSKQAQSSPSDSENEADEIDQYIKKANSRFNPKVSNIVITFFFIVQTSAMDHVHFKRLSAFFFAQ